MPRVSVLMPLYNVSDYVEGALASIFAQSLTDFEIIAIDDGSTDNTFDILTRLQKSDGRLKVFHKANGGIVSALNFGLERCTGDYIARMDGDDISHQDRLRIQTLFLDQHPDTVCIGTLKNDISLDGSVLSLAKPPIGPLRQTDLTVLPPIIATLAHPGIMVRSAALRLIGGYRTFFPHAEDFDLFLRLAPIGRIDVTPEVLLQYRVHPSSLSALNIEIQAESSFNAIVAALIKNDIGCDPYDTFPASERDSLISRSFKPEVWDMLKCYKFMRISDAYLQRRQFSKARVRAVGALSAAVYLLCRYGPNKVLLRFIWRMFRSTVRICLSVPVA